jgi:hypothetical protein
LSEFKTANELTSNDIWDQLAEQKLFADNPTTVSSYVDNAFGNAMDGIWAADLGACPGSPSQTGLPISVTSQRASAGGTTCGFNEKKTDGSKWFIKAACHSDSEAWSSNITLSRQGNQLSWKSERGSATYLRCGS